MQYLLEIRCLTGTVQLKAESIEEACVLIADVAKRQKTPLEFKVIPDFTDKPQRTRVFGG